MMFNLIWPRLSSDSCRGCPVIVPQGPPTRQGALRKVIRSFAANELYPVVGASALEAAGWEVDPPAGQTLRRGRIGDWQDECDGLTRSIFDAVAGRLVEEMGCSP